MKTSILDDYEFIGKRAKQIDARKRRICFAHAKLGGYVECWCFCAGPGGTTLACPEVKPVEENDGA